MDRQTNTAERAAITLEGLIEKFKKNHDVKSRIRRVESKRVDEFAHMSDEELEAYVNGGRALEH